MFVFFFWLLLLGSVFPLGDNRANAGFIAFLRAVIESYLMISVWKLAFLPLCPALYTSFCNGTELKLKSPKYNLVLT